MIELRQGTGAFVSENGRAGRVARVKIAQPVLQGALERLTAAGLTPEEIRRLFEAELLRLADRPRTRKSDDVSSDLAIETRGRRSATRRQALAGVDLHVPTGSVYGFLGRNGAGKTTTIKTLMGMVRLSGGEGHILRQPIADQRAGVEIRRRTAHGRGPQFSGPA